MESYSVQAVLSAVDSGFTSQMSKAEASLQGIEKGAGKTKTSLLDIAKGTRVFKVIEIGASAAKASLDKAFGRIDTMEQFNRTMTRMTGSSDVAGKALDRLSSVTTGTAYGLDVAAKATQDFVTRGMHIGDATRSVEIWADAVAFYGKGTNEQLETVSDALARMRTKGTVEMEQLNRLFDVGINAVGMYAQAVGRDAASVQEDLSARTISTNEFVTVVEKAMREGTNGVQQIAGAAKEAGSSWAGTFDNMKAATARGMVSIIQSIDGGLTDGALPDMRSALLTSAKTFEKFLKILGEGTSKAVRVAAPVLKVAGDNIEVIGATALTASGGLAAFKTAMAVKSVVTKATSAISAASSAIKNIEATYGALTLALGANTKAELLRTAAEKASMTVDAAGNLITKAGTAATYAETAAVLASTGAISVKTLLIGVLTGNISLAMAAQMLWNAAMAANPIGLVIGLVTAFVGVVVAASKAITSHDTKLQEIKDTTEKLSTETDELTSSVASSAEAYEANARSIDTENTATQTMLEKLDALSKKEGKSAKDKKLIQQYVDTLNSSVDGLNLSYDDELDMLNLTSDAIHKKIDAFKEQAKVQLEQERYIELLKEQEEVFAKLKETDAALADATTKYNDAQWWQIATCHEASNSMDDLSDTKSELEQKETELTEAIQNQDIAMEESAAKAAETAALASEAVDAGVQKQITSLEDLGESQRTVVESLNETWSSYVDQATNMFDTLSDETELSIEEMTANLLENQRVIGEWSDNIAILAQRGVDEGLLEQLRQAGPESAGYVKEMVNASDAELQGLSTAFSTGAQTATDAMRNVYDTSEMSESVQGLVFKQKESMQTAINTADFGSVGHSTVTGYAQAITENSGEAVNAATGMVSSTKAAAQEASDFTPPGETSGVTYVEGLNRISGQVEDTAGSMVHRGVAAAQEASSAYKSPGENSMTEYATGVSGKQGDVSNAVEMAVSGGVQAAANASSTGLASMSTNFTTEMRAISNIVDRAMKLNSRTVGTGMVALNKHVGSGLQQMQTITSTGMERFDRAIEMGMRSAVKSVTDTKLRMVTEVNTLNSSFYSAGEMASKGLARGVNAGSGAAIAAARSVADSVASTMRSALQIHSPSKVTTEIGEYAGEGVAVGLLNMISRVKKVTGKVASVMIPQPNIPQRLAYAGAPGGNVSNYTGERNTAYLIESNLYLDGRIAAKAITPFSELEAKKRTTLHKKIMGG